MPKTASQVADTAEDWSKRGLSFGVGYCLKFARTAAGAASWAPDATSGWKRARYRHGTGTPPRGTFVWWTGGSKGHGHVAVSDGKGYCWSTDIKRAGKVDRISIAKLSATWRNIHYVGWSEDVNGIRVTGVNDDATGLLLSSLKPGEDNDAVKLLQLALRRKGLGKLNPSGATGYYGEETKAMVKAFQQSEPSLDGLADGIPGPKTAALLGLIAL